MVIKRIASTGKWGTERAENIERLGVAASLAQEGVHLFMARTARFVPQHSPVGQTCLFWAPGLYFSGGSGQIGMVPLDPFW